MFFKTLLHELHAQLVSDPRIFLLARKALTIYTSYQRYNLNPQLTVDACILELKRDINKIYAKGIHHA